MSGTLINSLPVYNPDAPKFAEKTKSTQELQDNFFTMLTAQLEYQDPLKPMENVEFTNQMIGFYGLQQQQSNNQLLQKLADSKTGDNLNQGVSYLGRSVTVEDNGLNIVGGSGQLGFENSDPIVAHVGIYNSSDQLVKTLPDQTFEAGVHNLTINDPALANGLYRFRVIPANESKATITPLEKGVATGVVNEGGIVRLRLNNHNVELSQIRQVDMPTNT